jgi:tRNA (Thr-GGU) A37 N-methylase
MAQPIPWSPIGVVRSPVQESADGVWGGVVCRVELDESRFTADALAGLEEFSHVEILFVFDRVTEAEIEYGARHPRGRADWPCVGIFRAAFEEPAADSEGWRSAFRTDVDHDSEVMAISVPN